MTLIRETVPAEKARNPDRHLHRVKKRRASPTAPFGELENRFGAQLLKTVEEKTKKSAGDASNAVSEERQRISRELHDRVFHLLSGTRLRAETSRHPLLDNRAALEKELHVIEENIVKAITEIRNLLTENQNPEELQAGSLERRLKQELEIFLARTGFQIDFRCALEGA